jgi:hypothetical protein
MNTDTDQNAQPATDATPSSPASAVQTLPPAAPAPSFDPRRRLRELLSVPERDRSDAQWDEINELEIQLAPGNRINPAHPGNYGGGGHPGGGRPFAQKKHSPKGSDKGNLGGSGGGKRRPRPNNKPQ